MKQKKYYYVGIIETVILFIFLLVSCPGDIPDPVQYTLTVIHQGNGTTIPAGDRTVNQGETVTITAIPGESWTFAGWEVVSGAGCRIADINSEKTTVTITEDTVIQANFTDKQAPEGYSVQIDQPYINEDNATALSFTFSDAEVGGTYHYSIDDNDTGTPPVTGSSIVETETTGVTGINVSSLHDCTLLLGFYIIDEAGNPGGMVNDTVLKDTIPPGEYTVQIDQPYIDEDNTHALSFTISGADVNGTYYYSIDDDVTGTLPISGSGVVETEITNVTGINVTSLHNSTLVLELYIIDEAGNPGEPVYDTVSKDTMPLSGNFVINNDNSNTLTEFVTLTMSVSGGATHMRFGNTINELSNTSWRPYSETVSWIIPEGIGFKTIYGEFRDAAGHRYGTSDTICLIKKITASDGAEDDLFGFSNAAVSSDGSTIVVGADRNDDNGYNSGSVYVYHGLNWETETKITPSDGAAYDYFGCSMAVSAGGDTIVVGSFWDDDNGNHSGSVYIYHGTNWGTETKITASDGAESDRFSRSVAVSSDGGTIVVGANRKDDNGENSGSVYVYHGTNWGTETKITPSDGAGGDHFGCSVAVSSDGSTIVVGAEYDDDNGSDAGSAYVYDGINWGRETKIIPSDGAERDHFGRSVAVSSDVSAIVVGASGDFTNGSDAGSVYIYDGINWGRETKITPSDGTANDCFGYSVAVSSDGDTVVVGALRRDINFDYSASR